MKLEKENKHTISTPILDLSNPHRVLVLGDSITFIGHYLTYIEDFLKNRSISDTFVFYRHGRSAENLSGLCEDTRPVKRPYLFDRLEEVLSQYHDITDAIFCYGMNDGIFEPFSFKKFNAFKNGVNRLVQRLKRLDIKIIVMTPPPFDATTYFNTLSQQQLIPDTPAYPISYKGYDDVLKKYANWLLSGTIDGVCHTIDIHTPLKSYILQKRKQNADYSYGDGIHPDEDGHYIMASTIVKELFNIDMPDLPKN